MSEKFVFDGKIYKAVPVKDGDSHCEKCAFDYCRECEYVPEIPECDSKMRDDGKDVYFVEARTNFDRITESPEAMAEKLVYSAWDGFHGYRWSGIVNGIRFAFNTKEEAITATLKWLNKEDGNEKTNP